MGKLILKHGGYRGLKSFLLAQLAYDATVRFCDAFIDKKSRTHDQMVQAARSGVQNIAEGSQASGTSSKTELKLTGVARASLEELRLDYEDYLRQRGLQIWTAGDPRRRVIASPKITTADELALWVKQTHARSKESIPQLAANAILVIITIACVLLDRQIAVQAKRFEEEGGFTERLYKTRQSQRSQR